MTNLIFATIIFSISFGLIKANLSTLDPNIVVFLRLFFASLVFLPFFILNKEKISKNDFIKASLIGIIQFGLMYLFYIRAYHYLKGSEIALLTTSTPIFVTIVSSIYSKKIDLFQTFLTILAIAGGLFVVFKENTFHFAIVGVIFMELSNLTFALGQILWKKHVNLNSAKMMFPAYSGACLIALVPCLLFSDIKSIALRPWQLTSILYLGLIPTGLGFYLWNSGAKKANDTTLAVMNNLKIPVGALFAIIFFGEKINLKSFSIGFLIILTAIIASILYRKKNSKRENSGVLIKWGYKWK